MTIAAQQPAPAEAEPALGQSLRSRHVTMIAIGGIVGAGLFVSSSTSIATVGPAVIVSYLLAGLVILLIMRMLSEMAMLTPDAGSFTELIRIGLGDTAGFVSGWLYWYFWVAVVAIEAIAGAVIIADWIALPTWQIGMTLLAVMTGVNLLSTRSYGEFEFWFSTAKVTAILIFIGIAALWATGVTAPSGNTFSNLTAHGGFAPKGWLAVLAGVTSIIFMLCGAEVATIAAAEAREPARIIARITGTVAARILLFYILSMALIVSVVPWTAVEPGKSPFTAALLHMHVPAATQAMTIVILVAVLSCLNSGMYITSRVMFVMARRGYAPRALVALDARRVPVRATLLGSLFGYAAMGASILSPQLVFSFLVNASGAVMLFIYLLICLAQIRMRRRIEAEAPERLDIRMWLFPYASYATAFAIMGVLAAMLLEPSLRSQLLASLTLLASILIAWVFVRAARMRR